MNDGYRQHYAKYFSFKGKQLYILLRGKRGNNKIRNCNCKGSNYELILALNIYDTEFYKNALNHFFFAAGTLPGVCYYLFWLYCSDVLLVFVISMKYEFL